MLVDTQVTIAYKCSSCGSYEFFNISLFAHLNSKDRVFSCHCGKSKMVITGEGPGRCKVTIPCIGCGGEHSFVIRRKDLLARDICVYSCPVTGMEQCFLGKDGIVRKKVDCLEEKLDHLIDMFGYDSYFKNTRVMYDSLNKVHDIAAQGNLVCECGSRDVELVLLPDSIYLRCKRCTAGKVIKAASNEDLKNILVRRQILLMKEFLPCDSN